MNNLSKNIRYLRKQRKLSQQQLADELGVKRSNIAAYETKNVEPRLSLIHQMAGFFGVALTDLVVSDLSTRGTHGAEKLLGGTGTADGRVKLNLSADQQQLLGYSKKIAKMLEGFRIFYEYKRGAGMTESGQHATDLANFLVFIDHMLTYNHQVVAALGGGPEQNSDIQGTLTQSFGGAQQQKEMARGMKGSTRTSASGGSNEEPVANQPTQSSDFDGGREHQVDR